MSFFMQPRYLAKLLHEKKCKFDLLANEVELLYKAKTRIIIVVVTLDGVVTKYHRIKSNS